MKRPQVPTLTLLCLLAAAFLSTACTRSLQTGEPVELPPVQVQPAETQPDAGVITDPNADPNAAPGEGQLGYPDPNQTQDPNQPAAEGDGTQTTGEGAVEQPADQPEQATGPELPTEYTVSSGDTLGRIADLYGVTIEDIAAANNLTNINSLDVGQVLTIPAPGAAEAEAPAETTEETADPAPPQPQEEQTYTVRAGDTFYRIAQSYGLTVDELAAYNEIADPTRIDVGQVIRIPPSN